MSLESCTFVVGKQWRRDSSVTTRVDAKNRLPFLGKRFALYIKVSMSVLLKEFA